MANQTDYQANNNLVVSAEHWETGTGASLLSTQVEQTSVQSGRKE